ncbi:hypothetical protein GALL_14640 [mine drainage metagenome]|uniref:Uncharacterized protein n=1 Tax=mine drainage metagenome TaxID=410659 RepID=A0A1J5TBA3_9ZZZZ
MDIDVTTVPNILAMPVMLYCSYLILSLKSRIPGGMAGKSILNQPRRSKV